MSRRPTGLTAHPTAADQGTRHASQAARLLGGASLAAGGTYGAIRLGSALPNHPTALGSLSTWILHTRIDVVAVHLLWLIVVALAGYLAAVQVVAAAGHLVRSARTVAFAERASAGLTRRICAGALSAGLVGATVGALPAAAQPVDSTTSVDQPVLDGPLDVPQMRLVEDDGSAPPAAAPATELPAPTLRTLDGSAPSMRLLAEAPTTAGTVPLPAAPNVWLVRPGDNLWDIAEAVVAQDDGTRAEIDDVQRYWEQLIVANRANLADPHNPDLLFSGQQIVLPRP